MHQSTERIGHIIEHLKYARRLAKRFHGERNNFGLDREDFESAAYEGLCEAARRFDQSKGDFKTFSYWRIHGAMFDLMRHGGPVDRSYFRRGPTTAAREVPDSAKSLASILSVVENLGYRLVVAPDNSVELCSTQDQGPEVAAIEQDGRRFLCRQIAKLTPLERQVVEQHYFRGRSFVEIGKQLRIRSKSKISRIHHEALGRLRTILSSSVEDLPSGALM